MGPNKDFGFFRLSSQSHDDGYSWSGTEDSRYIEIDGNECN
jgi:hypothetical protein